MTQFFLSLLDSAPPQQPQPGLVGQPQGPPAYQQEQQGSTSGQQSPTGYDANPEEATKVLDKSLLQYSD